MNRRQPALAAAVDLRLFCRVKPRHDQTYSFRSGEHQETMSRVELLAFKTKVDWLRQTEALDEIRACAREFFAPTRYVLAHVIERVGGPGLELEWWSDLPIGSGLGSGAAACIASRIWPKRWPRYESWPPVEYSPSWKLIFKRISTFDPFRHSLRVITFYSRTQINRRIL